MKQTLSNSLLFILVLGLMSFSIATAQGHGGPGGGHHWPPGGGGGQNDSTSHDSSGFHWDHDGPGWGGDSTGHGHHGGGHGWAHGDSAGCDSTGQGGHHGGGHGWGHNDSTGVDSILISGVVSTFLDTIFFGEGHGFPGAPDSGEFVHTVYLLDIDADEAADYQLRGLHILAHGDSSFILPVSGDQVTVSGFLRERENGLDRIMVRALEFSAGTDGSEGLTTIKPAIAQTKYHLASKAYPNPFNPSTVIEFALEEAALTSLKIYDIRGVEVTTLINAQLDAGFYAQPFNPQGLSAGTYLYVLEANGQREVQRIAYLK